MKKLTPQQIHEIGSRIVGPIPNLWIPSSYLLGTNEKAGPEFIVIRTDSEISGKPRSAVEFWDELNKKQLEPTILSLTSINILVERFPRAQDLHQALHEKFLNNDLRARRLRMEGRSQPDSVLIFNRVGLLAALKALIGIEKESVATQHFDEQSIGALILKANDFITSSRFRGPLDSLKDWDLAVEMLPTWELINKRDLAYGLARIHLMISKHLAGDDSIIVTLRNNIALDPKSLRFDGILLDDFIAIVFGLFGHVMSIDPPKLFQGLAFAAIEAESYLMHTGFPKDVFAQFLRSRSISIQMLANEITGGCKWDREHFKTVAESDSFTTDFLPFRKHPLVDLENGKHLIIDIQFVAELLFTGLFFEIFFSMKGDKREDFLSLWGRIFELYLHNLLKIFYPEISHILNVDAQYAGGQLDAFLEFDTYVIVFEFKFFLLEHQIKHGRDSSDVAKEFRLKLVENEEGKPKALRQLLESARAILDGRVCLTGSQNKDIYPIVVAYEPCLESFGVNSFLNKQFQPLMSVSGNDRRIKPLTVISIQELEELLPQIHTGHFTWRDLLESRFIGSEVVYFSIHQAIVDLLKKKKLNLERNQFLLDEFESIYNIIETRYKPAD